MKSYDKEYTVGFNSTNLDRDVTFKNLGDEPSNDVSIALTKKFPVKMYYNDDSELKVNFKNTVVTYFNKQIPISSVEGLQEILDLKAYIADLAAIAFTGDWNDIVNLPHIIDCGTSTEVIDVSSED